MKDIEFSEGRPEAAYFQLQPEWWMVKERKFLDVDITFLNVSRESSWSFRFHGSNQHAVCVRIDGHPHVNLGFAEAHFVVDSIQVRVKDFAIVDAANKIANHRDGGIEGSRNGLDHLAVGRR